MAIERLHKKAKQIARQYKQCERELVAVIAQVDQLKGFYKLGYSSLFTYMTDGLGLTEAMACNVSAVVRKSYEVPQLKDQVVSGELSLSKARKLTPVINPGNQDQWLSLAQSKTQKQIEREVSLAQPKAAIQEKAQYISIDNYIKEKVAIKREIPRLKLELGVSEKLMIKLRRCQDLESQRQKKTINLENCLEELVHLYLEKKDPLKKAQRQQIRGKLTEETQVRNNNNDSHNNRPSSVAELQKSVSDRWMEEPNNQKANLKKNRREALPAKIKHQVVLRDQGQCTHVDQDGKRCSSRRHLEIHHIKSVSQGGNNSLQNLQLLCSGHHRVHHI